jgi:hypothetical protein
MSCQHLIWEIKQALMSPGVAEAFILFIDMPLEATV